MHTAKWRHRHRRRKREIPWWYLSFADDEAGGFLGGCYVQTLGGAVEAVKQAHALGINPGGQVLCLGPIASLSTALTVPDEHRNRLLTKEEIANHSGGIISSREFNNCNPNIIKE